MRHRLEDLKTALGTRYEIEHEIGHGGMAYVYLAHDLREDRSVAVKVVRPEIADSLDADSFLRNVGAVARLDHRSIMPLYDVAVSGGFFYLVMPHVQCGTLRNRLHRDGKLAIEAGVGILRDIIDALAFAHAAGVVHRDINAPNVLLHDDRAMITDFGLARTINEAAAGHDDDGSRSIVGSPAYMSPEEATASATIDHRADIYSVGALAYEIFTGRTPFTDFDEESVLEAHVEEAAEPIQNRRPEIPSVLAAAIMRCLAKDPADRWQSATEMLAHVTAEPGAPSTAADGRSFLTSRKSNAPAILIVLTATVLLFLVLGRVLFD